jgi:hypothetical protein
LTADTLQLADGRQMPGEQVISVRQAGAPPRRPHDRAHVLLANGDCIPGRVVAIANDKARIATDLGGKLEISLPLTALSAILFSPRAAAWSAQPDGRREISSPRARDSVRLVNGDTIAGNLVALPEGGPLRLDRGGQAAEIPLERIDAILLATRQDHQTQRDLSSNRAAKWRQTDRHLGVRQWENAHDEDCSWRIDSNPDE